MITCSECSRTNTIDGNFCRGCGHALNGDALKEARLNNDTLIADGFKLLADHRFEEALMAADLAVETDPTAQAAYSLRGDCLERTGDLVGAISAYEKALEFKADSTLDRIKLTHVRRVLSDKSQIVSRPNKRNAILAAVCACALVASIGSAIAIMNQGGTASDGKKLLADSSQLQNPEVYPNIPRPGSGNTNQTNTGASAPDNSVRPELKTNPDNRVASNDNGGRTSSGGSQSTGFDNLDGWVPPAGSGLQTIPLTNGGGNTAQPHGGSNGTAAAANPNHDPDPTPANNNGGGSTAAANNSGPGDTETNKPNVKPTMEIKPSNSNGTKVGGSETISGPKPGVQTNSDKGRQLMIAGDYAGAAQAYEAALGEGADPGITNQRLGQCYERLGKKPQAIRAYESAAAVYEERNSRSPSSKTQSALDSCRQAVKNLRG